MTDKAAKPIRIFLSYGHDKNAELVKRIRADLEVRGHYVWIDESEIKSGDNWRRSITEGILSTDVVLAFLSKHSVRSPGVCLDEIAIAIGEKHGNIKTILTESEKEVSPPLCRACVWRHLA
uniref:Tetratricopeptide domain protein n=2 Tax=environmental samples TaxID=67798 RepID=D9MP65_9BACT|nr:tetratricopeptide domain protein [uncultured Nitrospirae bacterium MY2-1F]ADI87754.1 tetratricopeptide domain protein [uncultured Nitrospirae bacterium MY3-11A]